MRFLWLFVCAFFLEQSGAAGELSNKSQGIFSFIKLDNSLKLLARFLPYNPNILVLGNDIHMTEECRQIWPHGVLFTSLNECKRKAAQIDFVWVQEPGGLPLRWEAKENIFKNVRAFYKSGSNPQLSSGEIQFIQQTALHLCTHWKADNGKAALFYLDKRYFDGYINALNYAPPLVPYLFPHFQRCAWEHHLKSVGTKSSSCSLPFIDYIYMINLDERPEKFLLSLSALEPYGIIPHRFSAVNGWELTTEKINELGLKYQKGMLGEHFLGEVFKKIDGQEYRNFAFIDNPSTSYFCVEMTRGSIGILLSHLSILQDAFNSDYKTIWIMEDDIQVCADPRQISSLVEEISQIDPDWDILFTDPDSKVPSGDPAPCRALAMRPNINIEPLSLFLQKFYTVNERFSRTSMRYGAYSMVISKFGIAKILDYYKKNGLFLPYDTDFWLNPQLRMYCTNKDIVSTIANAISDNYEPTYRNKMAIGRFGR